LAADAWHKKIKVKVAAILLGFSLLSCFLLGPSLLLGIWIDRIIKKKLKKLL
jgi:hypothetical protein